MGISKPQNFSTLQAAQTQIKHNAHDLNHRVEGHISQYGLFEPRPTTTSRRGHKGEAELLQPAF